MEELIFQYMPIELELQEPFGMLTRNADTVAVLARDSRGLWMLGQKEQFYPEGIARLIGGGMDQEVNPVIATQREIEEETGITINEEKLIPLVHAEITANLPDGNKVNASVFVFYAHLTQPAVAADDLSGIAYYSDKDLLALIQRYAQLPEQAINPDRQPTATWQHYGQVWGPIHKAAFERAKELGL